MFRYRRLLAHLIMHLPGHFICGALIYSAWLSKLVGLNFLLQLKSIGAEHFLCLSTGRELYRATSNLRARLIYELSQEREVLAICIHLHQYAF